MGRLIDADALLKMIRPDDEEDSQAAVLISDVKKIFRKLIDNAPTIDAVPVVRCGECKHSELCFFEDNGITKIEQHKCLHHRMGVNILEHDDYCSYGERREVDGK